MARKQKMKVYHGIPKSITDEHTVFYASFNGDIKPEIGQLLSCNYANLRFVPSAVGYGLKNDVYSYSTAYKTSFNSKTNNQFTVDMVIDSSHINTFSGAEQYGGYLNSGTTPRVRFLSWQDNKNTLSVRFYDSVGGAMDTIKIKLEAMINHVRLTYNNNVVKIYINGRETTKYTKLTNCKIDNLHIYQLQAIISDLRISDIDRGDYFPNLPQDFIDGKAVIKPKMGQQQIKGDPMYSQTTTVKIPAFTNETSKLYHRYDYNTKGYLVDNPEIFDVVNANEWNQGSKFKIKGLNEEIIGGVIDTNTALCKILSFGDGKINSNETSNKRILKVSTTKGLEPTDIVTLNNTLTPGGTSALVRTIDSVDSINNLITLREDVISSNILSYYLFETTASSSCPTVKTKNGATVQGVWSGLGTNEATFTLGANTGLQGQDLYVEYSLTTPYGNSDFPELPHTVERAWGENGVEMKPVSEIVVLDDFKGKLAGRNKECPHKIYQCLMSSLQSPNNISSNIASGFAEISSQSNISNIATLNDNKLCATGVTSTNKIPQQLFSFNLIEMVERKLGCEIPSIDKVQWLKENYDYVKVIYNGYGTNPTGNLVKVTIFDHSTNLWLGDWLSITTSSPSTKNGAFRGADNFNRITPNGILYVLAHTNPSDGATTSGIHTDYISVEISLKMDSTFTALYCENTRAREDKCNPVLVQEETKTVKRYLPSKECFATESLYVSQPQSAGNISGDASRSTLIEDPYMYICSLGTGFVSPTKEFYRDCLSNIGDSYIKSILCNLDGSVLEVNLNNSLRFTRVPCTTSNGNNKYVLPSKYFEGEYLCIKPFLTVKNTELMVTLSLRHMRNGTHLYHTEREYTITNRPLIK